MPIPRSAPTRPSVRVRLAPLALAALVSLPANPAAAAPRSPVPAVPAVQDAGWCADEEELAFLELVNGYRARNGLGPLTLSPTLGAAADAHSVEMAANNYFDHTMLGGVSIGENLANFGYPGTTYTENIAAGSADAAGTLGQWQGSAVHDAALLGGAYEALGIGRAYDPNSGYGWYWTAIFGGTVDGSAAPCGGVPPAADAPAPPPSPEPTPSTVAVETPVATALPSATAVPAAPTPSPAPSPVPVLASGAEAAADLNLRAGPGAGYDALGTVPRGSALEIAGAAEAGYLPVTVDGRFGWVAADFVEFGAPAGPASGETD